MSSNFDLLKRGAELAGIEFEGEPGLPSTCYLMLCEESGLTLVSHVLVSDAHAIICARLQQLIRQRIKYVTGQARYRSDDELSALVEALEDE